MNKRNKLLFITVGSGLLVGIILFLVAGFLSGWDFSSFLTGPVFVWIMVLLGIYILLVVSIFVRDWMGKL